MIKRARRLGVFAIVGALAFGSSGCIKKMLMKGQIDGTLKGSVAASTIPDFEVAKAASLASLARAEGLHYLAPDIEEGLFLLTKSWASAAFAFIEDEMEQAQDLYGAESELAQYHKARAAAAYSRAIHYAEKLLDGRNPGLKDAMRNAETMRNWLNGFTRQKDAPALFWFGQAWMSRVNLLKDNPDYVAELFVGMMAIKRSVELDENYNYGSGHVILGAYHSRSRMAKVELKQAKTHFDRAIELTGGRALLAKFNMAAKYHCATIDQESYVKLLSEVVLAGDVMPEQRLQNTIAKRKARRYLKAERMKACGFKVDKDIVPGQAKDEFEDED